MWPRSEPNGNILDRRKTNENQIVDGFLRLTVFSAYLYSLREIIPGAGKAGVISAICLLAAFAVFHNATVTHLLAKLPIGFFAPFFDIVIAWRLLFALLCGGEPMSNAYWFITAILLQAEMMCTYALYHGDMGNADMPSAYLMYNVSAAIIMLSWETVAHIPSAVAFFWKIFAIICFLFAKALLLLQNRWKALAGLLKHTKDEPTQEGSSAILYMYIFALYLFFSVIFGPAGSFLTGLFTGAPIIAYYYWLPTLICICLQDVWYYRYLLMPKRIAPKSISVSDGDDAEIQQT